MRNVIVSLFISLDGVVESPDQWQFDAFDDDMMNEMVAQLKNIDTVLLGRKTYEEWSSYWPTATDEPFASFINNTPKYVVSNTLDTVAWGPFNSVSLIKGDPTSKINELKQQSGKNIAINGSASLVQWCLQNNLLDELQLLIHPVAAGRGKRLFKDGVDLTRFTLTENKTTSTGVIMATYTVKR
jgi:dihydrofolate reductase